MEYRVIVFLLTAILLISCKKEQTDPVPDVSYASAIQLKVGNYWIYENKILQISSNSITYDTDDSVFISKDTIVNGKLYYKLGNIYGWKLVRDSSGYIVDHEGYVFFSAINFKDTIYRHIGEQSRGFMTEKNKETVVPAGVYKTASFLLITDAQHHHHHIDNDPSMLGYNHRILTRKCYARGVGMVKQELFFLDYVYILEMKRYKLN